MQFTAVWEGLSHIQALAIAGDMANVPDVKVSSGATPIMISKCANPQCSKALMRMDGGRFFGFHTVSAETKSKTLENFWLCSKCAKSFTMQQSEGRVEVVPRVRKTA